VSRGGVGGSSDNNDGGGVDSMSLQNQVYTSSVALVTSPDDWPVWRTRTPVVVALRNYHGRGVEQHRYRYMVVTPGVNNMANAADEEMSEIEVKVVGTGTGTFTSPEDHSNGVGVEVMAWEDPFYDRESQVNLKGGVSTNSLPSVPSVRQTFTNNLANLPYRTIEIDITTAQVKYDQRGEDLDINNESDKNSNQGQFTHDGIWIDNWNKAEDLSFCPYIVRDGINKQNKAKKTSLLRRRCKGKHFIPTNRCTCLNQQQPSKLQPIKRRYSHRHRRRRGSNHTVLYDSNTKAADSQQPEHRSKKAAHFFCVFSSARYHQQRSGYVAMVGGLG